MKNHRSSLGKKAVAALLALSLCCQSIQVRAQGVPVIDLANLVQSVLEVEQAIQQLNALKGQWDTAKTTLGSVENQFKSLTGKRLLGKILNNPKTRSALPENIVGMWDAISTGGKAGLTDFALQLAKNSKRFNCSTIENEERRKNCEVVQYAPLAQKAVAKQALDVASADIEEIGGLQDQIENTDDPKAVGELQLRMLVTMMRSVNKNLEMQAHQVFSNEEIDEARQAARAKLRAQMGKDAPKALANFKFSF